VLTASLVLAASLVLGTVRAHFQPGMVVVDSFNDSGIVWKRLSMNDSLFWYNTQTGESVWNDPRTKAPFEFGMRPRQL
jgi:hypothetical protein